jgi:hypothetical protein
LTFGHFDPSSASNSKRTWKSINVSHFKTAPAPGLDKRSSKGDQFSITVDPAQPDVYKLQGTYDNDVQVSVTVTRSPNVPGWKLGNGNRGGLSYFGSVKPSSNPTAKEPDTSAGSDGYVVHRFWPRTNVTGIVRLGKEVIDLEGSRGVFIHAIQGMRPNLIASRWNFADFQSSAEDGASLVMMEFTSVSERGSKVVNLGSVVVDDKLVAVVVGGTGMATGKGSAAKQSNLFLDPDTGYNVPQAITFEFQGPTIEDPALEVKATLDLQLGEKAVNGLMEKVDVMAEIPYFIKKVVNVVSGAKPYIYQVRPDADFSFFADVGFGGCTVSQPCYGYHSTSWQSGRRTKGASDQGPPLFRVLLRLRDALSRQQLSFYDFSHLLCVLFSLRHPRNFSLVLV